MFDVLIIGSGIAGVSSAISAKEFDKSLRVGVLSKSNPTNAQSSMAQGGINAKISNKDSIEEFIEDTLKSAKNLGDREAIEFMCKNSKSAIEWLDSLGVAFSRDGDNLAQRGLGGASFKRACYCQDYTGLKILQALFDRALSLDIEFLSGKFLLDLAIQNSRVDGAIVLDIESSNVEGISAKSTVLATGGYSRVYGEFSTNSQEATGDGVIVAKRAGCKVSDMEFIQFHPTGLKSSSILISESARGEGGVLIDSKKERFIDELATRDEISRAIYSKIQKREEVFLDISHLNPEFLSKNLPQEIKLAKLYEDIDALSEPIPIKPVAHYSMGGVEVDIESKTNIEALFAIGEVANSKVHGANRLGGNSLLEAVVFGRASGVNLAKVAKSKSDFKDIDITKSRESIERLFTQNSDINFYDLKNRLSKVMYEDVGVIRTKEGLNRALEFLNSIDLNFLSISDKSRLYNSELIEFLEFRNLVEIAKLVVDFSLKRDKSVGAYFLKS